MIKELTFNEFEKFANNHILANRYQTINYAMLMAEYDFDYDLIGYFEDGNLIAASLIVFNKLTSLKKYGYAPKGFLIDYLNPHLLQRFTKELISYYQKKNVVFIKVNPEIVTYEIDIKTKDKKENKNAIIKSYLKENNYFKLKENLYFESRLPRFNAFIDLKNYDINKIQKNTRNKIRRAINKGLTVELSDARGIDVLYEFVKNKRTKDVIYYKHYYNMFKKTSSVDVFLVKVNYQKYLENAQKLYEIELENNARYNENLMNNKHNSKNINNKMESDKRLLAYKNDIMFATKKMSEIGEEYVAAAMVVKYNNRVDIVSSGYDTTKKGLNANYFLHNAIIEYYKDSYDILDLNGLTGDFTDKNPYQGLNEFKLGFNPKIYEFIGEYDLLLKPMAYKKLYNNGTLARTLNKEEKELLQFGMK